jgi:tripartite-type tricarboxylate transporter receptor subunit TctC
MPALQLNPGFDPLVDLAPVTMTAAAPILLLVRADGPDADLRRYLERARAAPGKVSFASSGVGSTVHLAGETDSAFLSPIEALPHINAGRMRVLATAARQRSTMAPDAPAIPEEVPDYDGIELWFGLFGPRDLPQAAVARLMQDLAPLRRDSVLSARMAELSAQTPLDGPAVLAARLRAEVPLWKTIARQAGIPRE